jgi:PAS domain-containing protein
VLRSITVLDIQHAYGDGRGRVCALLQSPPTPFKRFSGSRSPGSFNSIPQRSTLAGILVSGLYALAGVLNLTFTHGILFAHVTDLNRVTLPWGEQIAFGVGPANPWRLLPDLAWFIVLAYALDAAIGLARRGDRGRAWFFGLSIFACLGIGYLHGTLIDLGVLPPPSIWLFTFLALIILMSVSLVDDVVSVPVLKRQIASQLEKWQCLIDNAKMLVFGLDTHGRINFVNPHFLDTTGYTEEEIIGQSLVDIAREPEKGGAGQPDSKGPGKRGPAGKHLPGIGHQKRSCARCPLVACAAARPGRKDNRYPEHRR